MKSPLSKNREHFILKKLLLFLALGMLFLGLNYRQLYSTWVIRRETQRLTDLAEKAQDNFHNPTPVKDQFDGKLSSDFWKFTVIDGGGKVSHESTWHAASMIFDEGLSINHFVDPEFANESTKLAHKPAPEQYNNVTLISGHGFRPTPASDVVLKFSSIASESFYGTAGVIFQPVGTLQENGLFAKPFDMFGFSVIGEESSIMGTNGPICYFALNWMPVEVESLSIDPYTWHTYEIRLRWISKTEWLGIMKVDDTIQCQMSMPALGPVEVHVWSDNALVTHRPRRLWEFAPSMDLELQNGGEKQFQLRTIQISTEFAVVSR